MGIGGALFGYKGENKMSTMMDVAKLAGVSQGTVSNVVNGMKGVSVDKIKKVEQAMAVLGYKPNFAAGALKKKHVDQIDMVVPNILDGEYVELYESVRRCAQKENYLVNLKVTDSSPDLECQILNQSVMNNVEGVILVTCQPANREFFEELMDKGLKIVFCIVGIEDGNCSFVGFDLTELMDSLIVKYRSSGKKIALAVEEIKNSYNDQIINAYCRAVSHMCRRNEDSYMEIIPVVSEYAARGVSKLFQMNEMPDVVIASNERIAKEIHNMEYLLTGQAGKLFEVIILNHSKDSPFPQDEVIALPVYRVGLIAVEMILHIMDKKKKEGHQRFLISPGISEGEDPLPQTADTTGQRGTLRVLLTDSLNSDAIKALLPNFTRTTGIEVEIVTRELSEMYDTIHRDRIDKQYDIYSIDMPWLKEFAEKEMIASLTSFVGEHEKLFSVFSEDVWDKFSRIHGDIYAIPYGFSVQLLFYRKDLFDKIKNQRLYFEWYGEELRLPKTWEEFNKIARLFTRKYNPDSETKYGVTLGGNAVSSAGCEFLVRLWAMNGSLFDQDRLFTDHETVRKALDNYLQAFAYADPRAADWRWNEQVEAFLNGDAAMMIMFTEYVSALTEKSHSKILDRYQVEVLPGKTSVLGGWALAVRSDSKNQEAAQEFLKWISRRELMKQNAVLGRVIPATDAESCESLGILYKWYDRAVEAFEHTRPRRLPDLVDRRYITDTSAETKLGELIHQAIANKTDAKEVVEEIREAFELLLSARP